MDGDVRRAPKRTLGILGAALALCALGIWGTVTSATGFGHAAGLTGTPGHLVAASCVPDPAEPNLVDHCRGVFRPEGDAPWVPEARVGSKVPLDHEVAVRCDGATCHLVAPSIAVTWAAAAFAALAALAVACRLTLGLARPRPASRRPEHLAVGAAVVLAACALLSLVAALITSALGG